MNTFVTRSEADSFRGLLLVFAVVALVVALRAMMIGGFGDVINSEPVESPSPTHFVAD